MRSSPGDGRAAVIYQTARSRALLNDALDIVEELEEGYAQTLGPGRLRNLKRLLSSLLDQIDPSGTPGRDEPAPDLLTRAPRRREIGQGREGTGP